jgi:hypothetical protein
MNTRPSVRGLHGDVYVELVGGSRGLVEILSGIVQP